MSSPSSSSLLSSPRSLFDDLLVASLDGTLALVEVDSIAVLVTQNLHLDVTRIVDKLLDQHPIISEARRRFGLRQIETFPTQLQRAGRCFSTAYSLTCITGIRNLNKPIQLVHYRWHWLSG